MCSVKTLCWLPIENGGAAPRTRSNSFGSAITGSARLSLAGASSTTSTAALRIAFDIPSFARIRATTGKNAYFEFILAAIPNFQRLRAFA